MAPLLLVCFSGTGSVGKVFSKRGWRAISVDINATFQPTVCADLLQREGWRELDVMYAHFSPPCTAWSRSRSQGPLPDLDHSKRLVDRCLEIIAILKPPFVTIEIPATSGMCNLDYLGPFKDVCYCMYSDWGYRKATRIWHRGFDNWVPRPMCDKNQRCKHWKDGRHPAHAQKGGMRWGSGRAPNEWTQHELYRIPEELVEEWANYIEAYINEQDRGSSVSWHVAAETRNTSP